MVAALVDTFYYLLHLSQHYYQRWRPGLKARSQGQKRKCSPKKKRGGFKKVLLAISRKKPLPKSFSGVLHDSNNSKHSAVREPRTG